MIPMLFLVIIIIYFYCYYVMMQHPAKFPPGPKKMLPFLPDKWNVEDLFLAQRNLSLIHGDIFGYWNNLSRRRIVLNSYELIEEASRKKEFSDRPQTVAQFGLKGSTGTAGILRNSGPDWSEQRQFTIQALKNLGMANGAMEKIISEEAFLLCNYIKSKGGEVIDNVREVFFPTVFNTIWRLVASERYKRNSQKLQTIMSCLDRVGAHRGTIPAIVCRYWPFNFLNQTFKIVPTTRDIFEELTNACLESIKKHEAALPGVTTARDFIDLYLQEISKKSTSQEFSTFKGKIGRVNLATIVVEFIAAGADTSYSAIMWAIYFMMLNPEIQEKVQNELDQVTCGTRAPTMDDRRNTPYTEAVIQEIYRKASPFPVSLHASHGGGYLKDDSYFVPPDTSVCLNFSSVCNDPKVFPEPELFRPERFLDSAGRFKPEKKVISFGLSKRRCPGEYIGRMQVYLIFTAILQSFTLKKCDDDILTGDKVHRINVGPENFRLRLVPRK